MSIVPVESDRFETMEKVANLRMQGHNDTQISKELGIQRKVVIELFKEYKDALSNDSQARDLARDYLYQMVNHYDALIKQFYKLVDDIDQLVWSPAAAAQKKDSLKAIAELDAKRVDALQKAGLLDSADLGDELAEMEEKHDILISILREDLCHDCRSKVATKLQKVTNRVEIIDAEDVVVNG